MRSTFANNAVIYYFPILFEQSIGQSHNISLLLGGVNMIVYAIFATVSWFIIERVGRRKLFLWGTVGQCLSMVIVFSCLIPGTTAAAKGAAVGLFTYIASFGASWLPLPWVSLCHSLPYRCLADRPSSTLPKSTQSKPAKKRMLSQLAPTGYSTSVRPPPPKSLPRTHHYSAQSTKPSSPTVIVMITPIMITNIQWGTYLFFAIVNACFLPLIYFTYPETARRSLEEIDIIFAKGFCENISYVRAAKELEFLTDEGIDEKARDYGLVEELRGEREAEKGGVVPNGAFGVVVA